jgi:hypothetical protein
MKVKHTCRRWINIWGDSDCVVNSEKDVASLKAHTRYIRLDVERHLFPEIFYRRKMVDRKSNILEHESLVESSLNCDKINPDFVFVIA